MSTSSKNLFWSDASLPLATINISLSEVPAVNSAPIFDSEVEDQSFEVSDLENNVFEYTIPSYSDAQGNQITMEVVGLNEHMVLKDNKITFQDLPEG